MKILVRTLVATVLSNAKGKDIYCSARKITEEQINVIRSKKKQELEAKGFTFIKMMSLDYPNIKGYVIFFEGHMDELKKTLKSIERGY